MRSRIAVKYSVLMAMLLCVLGAAAADDPGWWQPAPGTTWQWQLSGEINISHAVAMYDIDLFETPQDTIDMLHSEGRIVICYFSAGSFEKFRPDIDAFPASVKGKALDGWPGERWLDIRNLAVLGPIMEARLDLAVSKNCDGVEPDNVEGFANRTGFPLNGDDQITYNTWLAAEAHERSLSIGLKNDLGQIPVLVDDFDWLLNEQCYQYEECDAMLPFISAGKAVFGVEYREEGGNPLGYCPQSVAAGFSWLVKTYDLGDIPPNPCSDYLPLEVTSPGSGSIVSATPLIVWKARDAASAYRVVLTRAENGSVRDSGWLSAESICSGGVCQFTPTTLKHGTYTLKIKARWAGAVKKPASVNISFSVS